MAKLDERFPVKAKLDMKGEALEGVFKLRATKNEETVRYTGRGRAAFNKLYRVFKRKKLTQDTRLRFFETYVA